jgi:hypothetical protein
MPATATGNVTVNVAPRKVPRLSATTVPPVQFDDVFDQRQSEAQAAVRSGAGTVRPETIDDMREQLGRDSLTRVADDQLDERGHTLRIGCGTRVTPIDRSR